MHCRTQEVVPAVDDVFTQLVGGSGVLHILQSRRPAQSHAKGVLEPVDERVVVLVLPPPQEGLVWVPRLQGHSVADGVRLQIVLQHLTQACCLPATAAHAAHGAGLPRHACGVPDLGAVGVLPEVGRLDEGGRHTVHIHHLRGGQHWVGNPGNRQVCLARLGQDSVHCGGSSRHAQVVFRVRVDGRAGEVVLRRRRWLGGMLQGGRVSNANLVACNARGVWWRTRWCPSEPRTPWQWPEPIPWWEAARQAQHRCRRRVILRFAPQHRSPTHEQVIQGICSKHTPLHKNLCKDWGREDDCAPKAHSAAVPTACSLPW